MSTISITLPRPHAGQRRIFDEKRRFNVVACGRRFGKSVSSFELLLGPALQGRPVSYMAPTYKMLSEVWREAKRFLKPVTAHVNSQEKRIELITGGLVEFWSLTDADNIRGRKYARVVIDEAAMVKDLVDVWNMVIRPTLTDYRGDAFFLSTPKGRNGFWDLFQRGLDDTQPDWACFQMPTVTNPHIDPAEVESARLDVPELVYLQEYLAQFLESGGSVFRRVFESATAVGVDAGQPGAQYTIGADWARSGDYTVFTVMDVGTRSVVYTDRFTEVNYETQVSRLVALYERFRPQTIIAEANSMGGPLIESLQRNHGLPIIPFWTSNPSKCQIVDALALAFERGEVTIPNDPILLGELLSFEATRLPSGLVRYAASGSGHDDMVMSLCLAYYGVERPSPSGFLDFV